MNDSGMQSEKASREKLKKLKELLLKVDNRICADCCTPDPKWASANIGVFICLKCSGAHRSLGTHISKVLSVTLDEWSENEVDSMLEVGGNSYANSIYEAFLPQEIPKPNSRSSVEERAEFIRSKYERQEFLKPSLRIGSSKSSPKSSCSSKSSPKPSDRGKEKDTSNLNSSKNEVGMVEFIGILRIKVIKGSSLAVRDMISSDPYVVLTLGQQKAQTAVIKSNLNPVWNEDLKLSVPEDYGTMKVQVFDHDVILSDDTMGEAEVDLQPMITATAALGDLELLGDMQIGKWLESDDNALIADSPISVSGGRVVQPMTLRLQKVESGEIDLLLEWIPLAQ